MNELIKVETMTSLQIAEVTGKQHSHVLRDIRKMVDNINQSTSGFVGSDYHRGDRTQYKYLSEETQDAILNFAFGEGKSRYEVTTSSYTDSKGEKRTMYNLNKKACLLLASGYDVVLRSKIIDRWEELEAKERQNAPALPQNYLEALKALVVSEEKRIEAERKNAILMHVNTTYTATEIAKELNMRSANELNRALAEKRIQYKSGNTWVMYSHYSNKGYVDIKQETLDNGKVVYHRKFTQMGREFVLNLFKNK